MLTWCLAVPCFGADWWGDIKYEGKPWTLNVSRPNKLNNALNGRHISLWQSHGRYYDQSTKEWKWQRPFMFSTTEDLFTQTIVVPYLIPMLESAGAVVFTPRERDIQTHEVIVDNDSPSTGYVEGVLSGRWRNARTAGFHITPDTIYDGYNPFEKGTVRQINATHLDDCSEASYQPDIPESGRYAVYVSYSTERNSVDDAHYTVYHKGRRTEFRVNQQMGGSTWVYLGTFDFDKGSSRGNRVVLSARSAMRGVVTTDAVRFGGGMGNIARGAKLQDVSDGARTCQKVSGLPRTLEGARYYAQWAGAPRSVYAVYDGDNDYKEDINVRSLMTNWLSGGSPYNPDSANINPFDTLHVYTDSIIHIVTDTVTNATRDSLVKVEHIKYRYFKGKKVPFDMSLALHSDAGYHKDLQSVFGSLTICTTDYHDSLLNAGLPREHSKELASILLESVKRDLTARYGTDRDGVTGIWTNRYLWDRNYSESRLPGIPSAIMEMLSHQSFPDMVLAHDPDFKFHLARSIYKSLLRFEAQAHGTECQDVSGGVIVEPLAPTLFTVQMTDNGMAVLTWHAQLDSLEETATPTGYNVYMAVDSLGYDNGVHTSTALFTLQLKPEKLYRFRVTATNDGGESFPTEELCAFYVRNKALRQSHKTDSRAKTILIVNGFNRLSSPSVVDSLGYKGFDIDDDPGLTYGPTNSWSGQQKVFSTGSVGRIGPGNFSYSGQELQGRTIGGNDFNYVSEHAESMPSGYNIVSCSRRSVEEGIVDLAEYDCIDLLLGNEKDDGHSLRHYKTFTPEMRQRLSECKVPLIVSGSYVASDMQCTAEDSTFLADILHCGLDTITRLSNDTVVVNGNTCALIHKLNASHYATTKSDVLKPLGGAKPMIWYNDGSTAAITKPNNVVVLGFPLECVESKEQRTMLMHQILKSLDP